MLLTAFSRAFQFSWHGHPAHASHGQTGVTSAILGASRPEHLNDTLPATEVTLDAEELAACDEVWYRLPRARDPNIALR